MIIELSSLHAYVEIRETTRIEFCFVDTGWTQCITLSFLRGGFAIALEGILADLFFIDYSLFMSSASFFACRTQQQKSFLHSEKKRKILISGRPAGRRAFSVDGWAFGGSEHPQLNAPARDWTHDGFEWCKKLSYRSCRIINFFNALTDLMGLFISSFMFHQSLLLRNGEYFLGIFISLNLPFVCRWLKKCVVKCFEKSFFWEGKIFH